MPDGPRDMKLHFSETLPVISNPATRAQFCETNHSQANCGNDVANNFCERARLIGFFLTLNELLLTVINNGLEGRTTGVIPYWIFKVCVPIMLLSFVCLIICNRWFSHAPTSMWRQGVLLRNLKRLVSESRCLCC